MKLLTAIPALLLACGSVLADEVKGKIVSVDAGKGTITLSADGKDRTLAVEKGASIQGPNKKKKLIDIPGGLEGLKAGDEATATVEKKDGKDVVTRLVSDAETKKGKPAASATTVVGVDADKKTLTVTIDGKEKTLAVAADATIQAPGKKKMLEPVEGGLKGVKAGDQLTVTKDEKDVVTKIVLAAKKKDK
jgi:hypothetical protein